MRKHARIKLLGLSALLWVMTQTAQAHHSFAAEFDISRPIQLEGKVTRMEWSNPHSWVHLDVVTATGEVQRWKVEGGAPNALIRRGWNRNSLPPGTTIKVEGYQARDGGFRANGRNITLEDGSQLFVGSSDAGAPPAQ
ncbi:MAG: DUF6152 family protein [Pseudomonadales bacterium]|nr:DUF6152 family protein [Pseudomonadales bacterium]